MGCILHSGVGSTYIAYAYRELLLSLGIKQRMGKKSTCFDNARIVSFNGVFKTEALYAILGKNKVKTHQYPVKLLAKKTEKFILFYNL